MSLSKPLDACTYEDLLLVQRELDERFFVMGKGRYSTGKIYRIVQKDKFILVYVGSTIDEIDVRFGQHRSFIKLCPFSKLSQYIFANKGPDNFRIELIMHCPCRSKHELTQKEGYFIRLMQPLCNMNVPGVHPPSVKVPTKRDIQKEVNAAPRMYSEIIDINAVEATKIFSQMHKNKATCTQILQLQKHWFDKLRVQHFDDTNLERELVFEEIRHKKTRYIFENLFAFKTEASSDRLKELNPFEDLSESANTRRDIAQSLKTLCQLLGIESPYQNSLRIPQARFFDQEEPIDGEVHRLLNLMPTVKTKSKSTDPIKIRQMHINNIFSEWSRSTFQQSRHGGHKNGQKPKIDYLVKPQDDMLRPMTSIM